jgi:phospholipid/cholesterol/gamma-HCH transport system permease protein
VLRRRFVVLGGLMGMIVTKPIGLLGAVAIRLVLNVAATCRVSLLIAGSLRGKSLSAHWSVARETLRQIGFVGLRTLVPALVLGALVGMTFVLATSSVLQVVVELSDPLALWRRMGILLVREIGPILPAIIVAGWCGGVVTADLATKNVGDAFHGLGASGSDWVHSVVVPRVVALFVSTLALAVCFVLAVLVACGVTAWLFGDLPVGVFLDSVLADVSGTDLSVFAMKGAAFGLVVTGVAALRGLSSGHSQGDVVAAASTANAHALTGCFVVNAVFAVVAYA